MLLVVLLTAFTMAIEISVGYATGSMALLADGWHMATHVGALGLASVGYAVSRRYAGHRAFVFGTGKVPALAGHTSAVALGLVAALMVVESITRFIQPQSIDFAASLPVAIVGLVVNLASVVVLHAHDDEGQDEHDHNHRAALVHVVSDTLTSGSAILALLAGRYWGWEWLDPASGVVAGIVILRWSADLLRDSSLELLDVNPSPTLHDEVRRILEAIDDVRVRDLHVWSVGGGAKSCVVTLVSAEPRDPDAYRAHLRRFNLAHVTIEVQRCRGPHGPRTLHADAVG